MKNNRKLDIALNVGIVVLTLVLLVIAAIVLTSCTFEDPNSNSRNLNTRTSFDKPEGIGSWMNYDQDNYLRELNANLPKAYNSGNYGAMR